MTITLFFLGLLAAVASAAFAFAGLKWAVARLVDHDCGVDPEDFL